MVLSKAVLLCWSLLRRVSDLKKVDEVDIAAIFVRSFGSGRSQH